LRTTAFLLLQLPQIAGWLWQKTQAEIKKQKNFFDLIIKHGIITTKNASKLKKDEVLHSQF
jgi:hypothetical protein